MYIIIIISYKFRQDNQFVQHTHTHTLTHIHTKHTLSLSLNVSQYQLELIYVSETMPVYVSHKL